MSLRSEANSSASQSKRRTAFTDRASSVRQKRLARRDQLLQWLLRISTFLCGIIILFVVAFIVRESQSGWTSVGPKRLMFDESWNPLSQQYNMLPMVVGTGLVTLGALLITAPLGVSSALFLQFYAPRLLAIFYRQILQLMAGIPSVVYGLWGLTVLVPLLAEISPLEQGQSLLAGIVILAMMTLPTVALAIDATIRSISTEQIQAAAALGLSKRALIWKIVIPMAKGGIVTGTMMQMVRALGETMAILMICGNIVQLPTSLFDPIRTLTANLALEMVDADAQHRSVLFLSGLLLLGVVFVLLLLSELAERLWGTANQTAVD